MTALYIALGILAFLVILTFITAFICYRICFYSPKRKEYGPDEYEIPDGRIYEPYRDQMIQWMKETRETDHEDISIKSHDGLTLRGKYYHLSDGLITELMFHGYRGRAERDLCGGMQRCFALKRNVLMIDQRASGSSDGSTITFGIKERYDVLSWVNYAIERFGPDVRIMLTGISMGAATVMMAGGLELPSNVIGILADCGYTSPKDIIKKVIRDMKLPANLLYPFVKLGAKVFGHFDLDEASAIDAMKKCRVPVIFIHGEDDAFVPCDMSRACYEACTTPKMILTVPGAGHGLAFIIGNDEYMVSLKKFEQEHFV